MLQWHCHRQEDWVGHGYGGLATSGALWSDTHGFARHVKWRKLVVWVCRWHFKRAKLLRRSQCSLTVQDQSYYQHQPLWQPTTLAVLDSNLILQLHWKLKSKASAQLANSPHHDLESRRMSWRVSILPNRSWQSKLRNKEEHGQNKEHFQPFGSYMVQGNAGSLVIYNIDGGALRREFAVCHKSVGLWHLRLPDCRDGQDLYGHNQWHMSAFTRPGSRHVHTKLSHKEYIDPFAVPLCAELMPPLLPPPLPKHILVNLPPKPPETSMVSFPETKNQTTS